MIIIAFEGIDKCGKNSQTELLYGALQRRGYNVVKSEFHRYDTPTGQLIRRFLDGKYHAPQKAIECLMAADKYAQLDWFDELEKDTDVLLLDRYTLSQRAYSEANGVDKHFVYNLLEDLPYPDYTFYLDIEPQESMRRKGQHGENDLYESNYDLLAGAREYYKSIVHLNQPDGTMTELDASQPISDLARVILARTLALLKSNGVVRK